MLSVVLLSGPLAVGKSIVADALIGGHGFKALRSSGYLKQLCADQRLEVSREALQALGDRLDEETDYRWLLDKVSKPQIEGEPGQERWLIDSVRKERQVQHFEQAFGSKVIHAHLWAPEPILEQRYRNRLEADDHAEGATPYDVAVSHPNEVASRALKNVADLTINLAHLSSRVAAATIATAAIAEGAGEPADHTS